MGIGHHLALIPVAMNRIYMRKQVRSGLGMSLHGKTGVAACGYSSGGERRSGALAYGRLTDTGDHLLTLLPYLTID